MLGDLVHLGTKTKLVGNDVSNVCVAHHSVESGRDLSVRVDVDILTWIMERKKKRVRKEKKKKRMKEKERRPVWPGVVKPI